MSSGNYCDQVYSGSHSTEWIPTIIEIKVQSSCNALHYRTVQRGQL
jgi:hypothetical protein